MPELESPEIFRAVLESLQTGIYFVDSNKRILFWNDGAEKITGYLRHEVVGSLCTESSNSRLDKRVTMLPEAEEPLTVALRDGKSSIDDISLRHRGGHRIYVRLRTVPIRNSHGTVIAAAQSFDENPSSADWDRRQNKLADYGCLDPMSGVLNKEITLSHLHENLITFEKHQVPFSILCIEVDHLDQLRQNYGKAVIGSVMHVVAQTLENSVRPTDFLGRIAANRFLAILIECAQPDIEKTARRLKKIVSSLEIKWWGDQWSVSASFGGTAVRSGDGLESILERAEKSLAESLASGGNQVTVAA
jgi:diguanylate cyclase (GGDEF)-like protein/PAS domain S-box-containing protein